MLEKEITRLTNYSHLSILLSEAVARRCSVKKVFLKISQNLQENTCARVSFSITLLAWVCNFIKKETLAQTFSCEFCKNFKNTFFYRTPPVAAFILCKINLNVPHLLEH